MGLLLDRATTRWSAQQILNWSRVDAADETTNDTTRLGEVEDSAEAEFELYTGETYDDTLAAHRHMAMKAFETIAREYGGSRGKEAQTVRREWEALAKQYRIRVGSEARIVTKTSVPLTPTPEQSGTETVRPDTDLPGFDGLIPNNRGSNESEDSA